MKERWKLISNIIILRSYYEYEYSKINCLIGGAVKQIMVLQWFVKPGFRNHLSEPTGEFRGKEAYKIIFFNTFSSSSNLANI